MALIIAMVVMTKPMFCVQVSELLLLISAHDKLIFTYASGPILNSQSHLYLFFPADKCRLPFYGGCSYTKQCATSSLSANCRDCLPGLVDIGEFDCVRKLYLISNIDW